MIREKKSHLKQLTQKEEFIKQIRKSNLTKT